MKYFTKIASGLLMVALCGEVAHAQSINTFSPNSLNTYQKEVSPNKVVDSAKEYVDSTISQIIEQLEFLKDQVTDNMKLSAEQKENFSQDLDEKIIWLLNKRDGLAEMDFEEVKIISNEIREYWEINQYDVKKILGEVSTVRIDLAIDQLESFAKKVEAKIQSLKFEGNDLSSPEEFLQDFRLQINSAKISNQQARESFEKVLVTYDDADNYYNKGQAFVKESHYFLRQSHRSLKKSVQALQGL